MSSREQNKPDLRRSLSQIIGWCQAFSLLMEVWLRIPGTAGGGYWKGHACIGWISLLVIAAFGQSEPLIKFWAATGGMFLFQMAMHTWRVKKGYRCHSRFVGISLFSICGNNEKAIRYLEPLFTFLVGILLIQNGHGYGGFAVIISLCMFVSGWYASASEKAQITAVEDARIEQEWLSRNIRK